MTTEKIQFTKEKETMLMTLYARAVQSQGKNPILPDQWAEDAIRRIDYDFSKFKLKENDLGAMTIAIRSKNLICGRPSISRITLTRRCCTWAAAWTVVSSASTRLPVCAGSMWTIRR